MSLQTYKQKAEHPDLIAVLVDPGWVKTGKFVLLHAAYYTHHDHEHSNGWRRGTAGTRVQRIPHHQTGHIIEQRAQRKVLPL